MAVKFGRNYILLVQTQNGGVLTVQLPFTIEFDITRNILNSANVASIRIYNLSPQTRDSIGFNIYNQGAFRTVQLFAGYGTQLSTIFSGNITQCWSVREGVNFITQIECFDGGFVYNNNTTNLSFPSGTPNSVIINTLIANLSPTIKVGTIQPLTGTTGRGKSYSGNTCELLGQLTNGGFFIDNGTANVLNNQQTLQGSLSMINYQNGLLGTPVREQNILTFDMIFEPRLQAGQGITLTSLTAPNFNSVNASGWVNYYKLNSVKHRGMISETVCGSVITTCSMSLPALPPGTI